MTTYKIVSRDYNETFYGEDDERVTWTRHVHVIDATGRVVNTGMGFETTTEERRFVDGLSMGLRIAGHVVEYVEEVESCEESKVSAVYETRRPRWSQGRVSA
jgi:hypothetical protein